MFNEYDCCYESNVIYLYVTHISIQWLENSVFLGYWFWYIENHWYNGSS